MWRVSPALREAVRWRRLNLIEDRRSVRPFDLILCRYVLGDFDLKTRGQVLARFAPALSPAGMLLLGVGESPGSPIYEPQDEELGLFRRNPAAGLAAA
jgi:chemotaxis protein methyltransferase CheR